MMIGKRPVWSFDIETTGELPEYALQPWRVRQGKARITTMALTFRNTDAAMVTKGQIVAFKSADEVRALFEALLKAAKEKRARLIGWNMPFDCSWVMAYELEQLASDIDWLDAMLLWKAADNEPTHATDKKQRTWGLKKYVDIHTNRGGYEHGVDYHDMSWGNLSKLLSYNKDDTVETLLAGETQWERLNERQRNVALTEAYSIPIVARANLRGMNVDLDAAQHLDAQLDLARAELHGRMAELGVTEDIVRSPAKLRTLLFKKWGLPVIKENDPTAAAIKKAEAAGVPAISTPSTDKEVLHELAVDYPNVAHLGKWREAMNLRTKFVAKIKESADYNGEGNVTHPQAIIMGTYCVPGDVEVMTRQGWVRLDHWSSGEIVQVRPDFSMEFLPATRFEGPMVDKWVQIKHRSFDCRFTHGHTMPYLAQKTFAWRTKQAHEFLAGEQRYIPCGGHLLLDGQYTPQQMRLFAAIQADGSESVKEIKWILKKVRKKDRLRTLLQSNGIVFREYVCKAYPERTEFHVTKINIPAWMWGRKHLGPWLLDTTFEGLSAFVSECEHWDGSPHKDGGFRYSSFIRSNLEWVVTAAALIGRKAMIHAHDACHVCDVATRPIASVRPKDVSEVDHTTRAYCAETQTGFWLARSNGRVFVTGNTGRMTYGSKQGRGKALRQTGFALHQMKRDKRFRDMLVAPPGHLLVEFDAAGQEFRWMAIESGDVVMLSLSELGEDPHSYMAAQISSRDYRELVRLVKAQDSIAGNMRKGGKVANLSLQYRTSKRKLRVVSKVQYGIDMTEEQAEHNWITYRKTYPGVPTYWQRQITFAKANGYVENLAGRRVELLGSWEKGSKSDYPQQQTAINFPIQGVGGDQKYLAIRVMKPYLPLYNAHLAWDLHDGLYFYVPEDKALKFAVEMQKVLDALPYRQAWGLLSPIPLPWDAKIGPKWGSLKEITV